MKKKPTISIIMPTFNGMHHLKKCLPSIYKLPYPSYEIILVENNSTDETVAYVSKKYPKIKLVRAKENYGYAKGNDIGYHEAKGKYIVFLSNDTRVEPNFLNQIMEIFESDPTVGCIQSKLRLMDEPTILDSVSAYFTNTGFLYHYGFLKKDSKKYSKIIDIFSAKGACMTFRREVLESIAVDGELFDSRYFAYYEESDLCHRTWLNGYRIVYAPKSIIYHKMGGTSTGFVNSYIQFHSFKNRINSLCKNLEIGTLITVLPVHLFMCICVAIAYLFQGNVGMFGAIFKAMWWNIRNLKATLRKRKYIQTHIRKLSDKEIFSRVKKNPRISFYWYLFKYRGLRYFVD